MRWRAETLQEEYSFWNFDFSGSSQLQNPGFLKSIREMKHDLHRVNLLWNGPLQILLEVHGRGRGELRRSLGWCSVVLLPQPPPPFICFSKWVGRNFFLELLVQIGIVCSWSSNLPYHYVNHLFFGLLGINTVTGLFACETHLWEPSGTGMSLQPRTELKECGIQNSFKC